MRRIDVFNGDADGICALHQLRLAQPCEAELVTGLKHEIALLERVQAGAGDLVTVLDVSLDRNRAALVRLLGQGARVRYFDHHFAGEVPRHPGLQATLDSTGLCCTSELVDRELGGRFRPWAVVAAYGDNLVHAAERLATGLALDDSRRARLRSLGESLNYNAYGAGAADVLVHPADLYRIVSRYEDPFALLRSEPLLDRLDRQRSEDLGRALAVPCRELTEGARAWILPDEAWSRRVLGTLANRRVLDDPRHAHAVLAPLPDGAFVASVRVPAYCPTSAAEFCRRYPRGGGRTTAAGVERLEALAVDAFLADFASAFAPCAHATRTPQAWRE
jgi:hypothetical protein